jgi:acetyl-CoA carboxylase carboxyl transferase subunit alpha
LADPTDEQRGSPPDASTPDLEAWRHVLLSRHENRPHVLDYIARLFSSFRELHGDRKYADDPAIVGGFAVFEGQPVMVVGQQKGRKTSERLHRNYGMPKPEGYRKAIRLMQLAEKFTRPVLTFIDTPGAYPGVGAEERGQAEAIAYNLRAMSLLRVPIIVTVLGEGGSGGALAIGLGDRVLMLENAIYSVISPESCSAILWKDQEHAQQAAHNLRITASSLLQFGVINEIVPEPAGGAQSDWDQAASLLKERLLRNLHAVVRLSPDERLRERFERFRRMGEFFES